MGVVIEDSYRAASGQHVDHYVICGVAQMRCELMDYVYISGLLQAMVISIKMLGSCQTRGLSLQVIAILPLATSSHIF